MPHLAAMQSENPLLADFAKLMNAAAGTLAGMGREARDGARERMREAVKTIKGSRLGQTTGSAALYELPWYIVIGNPAAGKSLAVVKSGLKFPFSDNTEQVIQGIGGLFAKLERFNAISEAFAEPMDDEAFWDVKCDILVPAALEGQITKDNAGQIKAKLVIEGANGPTTTEADDILHDKGVLVLPDVIANAGGVTVSYFEWVQDFSSFFWSEDEINARLVRIMQEAFAGIWQVAQEHKVSLRTATFIVACQRILHAREMRGLYP